MYNCAVDLCDEENVFLGDVSESADTIEEAKRKASVRCQEICKNVPVAYVSVTVTDAGGNYVDGDEFTLHNGELAA